MYTLLAYGSMIADTERTSAYSRALQATVTPGSVVLDIGTGIGMFAFLACRAGARKVYAVEPAHAIQLGRELAEDNGLADRIEFIQANINDVDLPEKVDGVISDIRGVLPTVGDTIAALVHARNRFLKPRGWMISARDTLWATLVHSAPIYSLFSNPWTTDYGFDFSRAR